MKKGREVADARRCWGNVSQLRRRILTRRDVIVAQMNCNIVAKKKHQDRRAANKPAEACTGD